MPCKMDIGIDEHRAINTYMRIDGYRARLAQFRWTECTLYKFLQLIYI